MQALFVVFRIDPSGSQTQTLLVHFVPLPFLFLWIDQLEPQRPILSVAAQLPPAAQLIRIRPVPDHLAVLQVDVLPAILVDQLLLIVLVEETLFAGGQPPAGHRFGRIHFIRVERPDRGLHLRFEIDLLQVDRAKAAIGRNQ